jgi:hypothetical protein
MADYTLDKVVVRVSERHVLMRLGSRSASVEVALVGGEKSDVGG